MKYNQLLAPKQKAATRLGRGISAGGGKTAGRGTKGQGSRKSPGKAGFEGGQTPLAMRLPKLRGFKSHRVQPEVVYTSQLLELKPAVIDNSVLAEAGLVSSAYTIVKLIQKGEFKAKKTVKLQVASANAIKAIEKAGGTFAKTDRTPRPKVRSPRS